MLRFFYISLLSLSLIACATHHLSPASQSYLEQGKRDFELGYYKTAFERLLPVACEGDAQAQYAVGYMYYYGYGTTQDSFSGRFWIERSAKQHYKPAENALALITKEPRR